ncbi:MAG: carbohydrate ABC transporter permease [Saccharofermentanales bacterium]
MASNKARVNSSVFRKLYDGRYSWMYLSPYLILFLVFTVAPVFISIYYSFTNYDLLQAPKWVGLDNYKNLFVNDDVFRIAIKNTLVFAIITGPVGYVASLMIAWMLNEFPPKFRAVMVLLFYAPTISGQVYMIWGAIFSSDSAGYANGFLMQLGVFKEPARWLKDPEYMMPIIILVALWMSLGAGFLSFIAGLQGLPRDLYEAAYVDGIKNRFQELWFITLPMMRPQLMFGAIMAITSSFAAADVMTGLAGFPSVGYAAHTIVTHLMDYGSIRFEMGYASAIASILFVTMVVLNKVIQFFLGRIGR